jgi:hypothetical protein
MKVLIGQPFHERRLGQLERCIRQHPSIDALLFPEGYLGTEELVHSACNLAKDSKTMILAGYRCWDVQRRPV